MRYFSVFIFILCSTLFSNDIGIIIHEKQKIDDSFRLFSSRHLSAAHLMRPDGRIVHSWYYPAHRPAEQSFSGFGMSWHYAEMLPNGNLVAIIKDEMILELDWHSNLVWKAELRAHHDFARLKNGHTIVVSRNDLTWNGEHKALDELVQYDSNGNIVWTWHYKDHETEIEKLVSQPLPSASEFRDWPHINTCEVLPPTPLGNKDERFKTGNLLLCGRHSNTIFIVDKSSGQVVWAWGTDQLLGPHMPTMLANGHILVYDNGHHTAENSRGYTRVLEIEPVSGEIVWQYQANPPDLFFSPSRGSANRLPNGNTLIAESDKGHLIEVTPDGDAVWEYWNSDFRENGQRMPLYRVVPYNNRLVDGLLDKVGHIPDVISEHQETLEYETLGRDHQYKRYLREVTFFCELGYFDHALKFLDAFMEVFPDDPEGYWGYSLVHACKKNPKQSFYYMLKAIDHGMALERFSSGLGGLFEPLLSSRLFNEYMQKQNRVLVHGPILGDVTSSSASIWLRTYGQRKVQVIARPRGTKDYQMRSAALETDMDKEYTAICKLNGLEPETAYEYKLVVDQIEQEHLYHFKSFVKRGEPAHFSTGFGGGAGATPKYEYVWDTLSSHYLPFFLFLGDNVYIDHPERPVTQQFCYYRRQSRPEFQRFSSHTALYAIWDDHDFTFNDGKGSPYRDKPEWKMDVWRLFRNQWVNPAYGGGEENPGCWFSFSYGDVDFFMLDCRYYREQPDGNPGASMLGDVQKAWLKEKLNASKATFKVLASSVPWAKGTKPGSLDTWDGHPQEREEIFSYIEDNEIEGVILISADRHRSDVWKIQRPDGYDFYEFESSKLSNIHTHRIMPGAIYGYNKKNSFGILEFDTTLDDPRVIYKIYSIDNEEIFKMTVFRSDLDYQ